MEGQGVRDAEALANLEAVYVRLRQVLELTSDGQPIDVPAGGDLERQIVVRVLAHEFGEPAARADTLVDGLLGVITSQSRDLTGPRPSLGALLVDADHIVVLERGKVVEHGTHPELLGREGLYCQLWQQQRGFVIDAAGRLASVEAAWLADVPILSGLPATELIHLARALRAESSDACVCFGGVITSARWRSSATRRAEATVPGNVLSNEGG